MANSKGKKSSMTVMQPCNIARTCVYTPCVYLLLKRPNGICRWSRLTKSDTKNVQPLKLKPYLTFKSSFNSKKPQTSTSWTWLFTALIPSMLTGHQILSSLKKCLQHGPLRHVQPGQAPLLTPPDKKQSLGFLFPGFGCHGTVEREWRKKSYHLILFRPSLKQVLGLTNLGLSQKPMQHTESGM